MMASLFTCHTILSTPFTGDTRCTTSKRGKLVELIRAGRAVGNREMCRCSKILKFNARISR